MESLNSFIERTKGTAVDWPNADHETNLKGQCVTLVQNYINSCLGQPAEARGHAVDWITSYVNEGLGKTVADQKTGDLIVFPNEAWDDEDQRYLGHIGIWVDGKIYDQNNARHDKGLAGFGEVFNWDFVTLRPNVDVIIDEPQPVPEPQPTGNEYLNLNPEADTWRVYPMDVAPVVGNECGQLLPKQFDGLSYTIKGYTMDDVAIIETRDFGEVQIYINTPLASITKEPTYQLVN